MFDITVNDVLGLYKQLKDSYPLVLTTTSALNAELDAGFTMIVPSLLLTLMDKSCGCMNAIICS